MSLFSLSRLVYWGSSIAAIFSGLGIIVVWLGLLFRHHEKFNITIALGSLSDSQTEQIVQSQLMVKIVSSSICGVIFIVTMLCLASLAKNFMQQDYFSVASIAKLRRVALMLLVYSMCQWILPSLLSAFLLRANPDRLDGYYFILFEPVSLSFGIIAVAIYILTKIWEQAREAIVENDEFL